MPLHVVVRTSTGEERLLHQTVAIPANATGTLQLVVSDGPRLGMQDLRDARRAELQPVSQIVRAVEPRPAQQPHLRAPDGAGRRRGRRRRADARAAGVGRRRHRRRPAVERRHHACGSRRAGEWEIPVEFAVSGSRQLSLTVEP